MENCQVTIQKDLFGGNHISSSWITIKQWQDVALEGEIQPNSGQTSGRIVACPKSSLIQHLLPKKQKLQSKKSYKKIPYNLFFICLYLGKLILIFCKWKLSVKRSSCPINSRIQIPGVTFGEVTILLLIKHIWLWLGIRMQLLILNGFGSHPVKLNTSSSFGYFFMTDLIQGIFWQEKISILNLILVRLFIVHKKKRWSTFYGLVRLQRIARTIYVPTELEIYRFRNRFLTLSRS